MSEVQIVKTAYSQIIQAVIYFVLSKNKYF